MLGIIALVLIAIVVAVSVLSFTAHLLFTPWVLVALGVLAGIKFRPRRSHE